MPTGTKGPAEVVLVPRKRLLKQLRERESSESANDLQFVIFESMLKIMETCERIILIAKGCVPNAHRLSVFLSSFCFPLFVRGYYVQFELKYSHFAVFEEGWQS